MERKDVSVISTMIAVLSLIVLLIIGFATESYLAAPLSSSTGDDSAWHPHRGGNRRCSERHP